VGGFKSRKGGDRGTLPAGKPNRHRARRDIPKRVKPDPRHPNVWAKLLRGHDKIQLLIWRAFPNHPRFQGGSSENHGFSSGGETTNPQEGCL